MGFGKKKPGKNLPSKSPRGRNPPILNFFDSVCMSFLVAFDWDHPFSTYAKLSEKLTFLTP